MTKELTQERARDLLRYDAETGILMRKLKSGRWKICGNKPTHNDEYGQVNIDGRMYLTHRLIWLLLYGAWPENEIDHIDRDPMNNRINNLRIVTRTENMHNRNKQTNNSSGYPGVYFNKQRNKYMAHIKVNRKKIYLGLFNTAEEAFTAYILGKIEHHPTSPISQEY